jgi:hypothetical protein
MTIYQITLRDRETQTVVGYYNGSWTTDRCRAVIIRRRDAAEAHAARMRDQCPRNADLIKVEEIAAANCLRRKETAFDSERSFLFADCWKTATIMMRQSETPL